MSHFSCEKSSYFFKFLKMGLLKRSNLKKILLGMTVFTVFVTIKFFVPEDRKRELERWDALIPTPRPNPEPSEDLSERPKKGFLKVFHLDLKGGAPKVEYLLRLLPVAKRSGANALLLEYEDMFPFSGRLRNVSAGNAYTIEEVENLVEVAESSGLEVIPLVQTFGHLEYVLKLDEFQHLRELDSFPQEICPSRAEAVDLVKEMVRQVMEVHRKSRYLHIGCDEVRHLAACHLCSRTPSRKLFSRHVVRIANFVRSHYPGVVPLIWDDMLRTWTFDDMTNSGLGSVVEPVIWAYGSNIFVLVPRFIWAIYQRTFPRLWIASAFKGAFGETEIIPSIGRHLENNLSWMKIISREEPGFYVAPETFAGVFVTGWSRYDHFAVLCELLPVAVPSLVLSLLAYRNTTTRDDLLEDWLAILGCPHNFRDVTIIGSERFFRRELGNCSFPGNDLYRVIARLEGLRDRVKAMARRVESSGWVSGYNLRKNFTSPWRVMEMFPKEGFGGEILRREVVEAKTALLPVMKRYFDDFTVTEWEEQNIRSLEEKLREIRSNFQTLIRRKTWPRRPLR